jgi:3-dehydroshikimate dehydratase
MTLTPGLVSITFRSLQPQEIIRLAGQACLQAIEWGGDVHVPPGAVDHTRDVGRWTREAGLTVSSYGSYYRLGDTRADSVPFEAVLESAVALGAPTIRVWAGGKGSVACSADERRHVIEDALRVADLAARSGISISLEYHAGTLTDTPTSVRALLSELVHPQIEFLWQPAHGESVEDNAARLIEVLPRVRNVHVFHWWPTDRDRRPLGEGEERWHEYIRLVRASGRRVDFLLEFVAGDATGQLLRGLLVARP